MNARRRSNQLISRSEREAMTRQNHQTIEQDLDDFDPFSYLDEVEPEHRSSLDAVMHERGREWLGEGYLVRGR